ncbi:YtxH domain-containing protein [Roseofilum casamattae]|uniref:YtxH domain-containing protein n=1 Tax=Roseofilum casamattae BLCC-M143 TaxID=3022442 RepID=A0ABT7C2D1_9CYAN|nr:YtxH domain-containing protein [Roseofilum casamattae]MDJ1185575.1 YtxH domain-containing protein [Roseofilum casamattae BLCC-M143]
MSQNNSGQWIGGLLLGAVVGTVTGILIAPRSGQQTRKLLKKSAAALPELAEDLSSSIQFQADRLSESTKDNWDGTLTRLREAIAAGVEAGLRDRADWQESMDARGDRAADAPGDREFTADDLDSAESSSHYNSLDL